MEVIVLDTGLRPEDDKRIKEAFSQFIDKAKDWAAQANAIQVKDEYDEAGMDAAAGAYKALRELQKEVEDTHKRLKEGALKYGQALDKIKRDFNSVIEPAKVRSRELASYAENLEKQRKAKLKEERIAILAPYKLNLEHYDLENMPQDLFEALVRGLKLPQTEVEVRNESAGGSKAPADLIAKPTTDDEIDRNNLYDYIAAVKNKPVMITDKYRAFFDQAEKHIDAALKKLNGPI